MPRDVVINPAKFCDGDRVRDARGNVGYARWQQNRQTAEWFWGIKIAEGPDKAKVWGKAYQFTPILDYDGGTIDVDCTVCDRPFKATALEGQPAIPAQLCCRTHRNRDPRRSEAGYLGSDAWKTQHHSIPSRRAEAAAVRLTDEQVDAGRRQREEDEKGMPF